MSAYRETLVVATTNRGKLAELTAMLAALPIDVRALGEVVPGAPEVAEDGATFAENAIKKAVAAARSTMTIALADDSGLEVDALGGLPGVRSARFAHPRATDAENNEALLTALGGVPEPPPGDPASPGFRARFRCVLALVDPFTRSGEPRTVEGSCEGSVIREPRGSGGFGYDPLFVVAGTGRTMAELDATDKNRVSHRARAFAALLPILEEVIRERAEQVARLAAPAGVPVESLSGAGPRAR